MKTKKQIRKYSFVWWLGIAVVAAGVLSAPDSINQIKKL